MKRSVYYRLDGQDERLRSDLCRLPGFAGVLTEFKPGERQRKTLNSLLDGQDVAQHRIFEFMQALIDLADRLEDIKHQIPQIAPDRERQIKTCEEVNEQLATSVIDMEAA